MEHYPNPLLEDKFLQYAKEMHEVMTTLSRIVDYELSFSQSNVEFEKLHLAKFIRKEFERWKDNLDAHNIELDLGNMDDSIIINTNRQFIVEILDNLIDNSIKAMSNSEKRLIKVSLFEDIEKSKDKIEKDDVKIVFSDMNYRDSAPKFQCFLMKHERNQFIRSKSEYVKLLTEFFNINKISVIKHPYRIPYEKIIFECHLR